MNRIYLDNAATTKLHEEVLNEMMPYLTDNFGNASSVHSFGRDARLGIDKARDRIAKALGASSAEIYFTSGGTEADNWALKGIAEAYSAKGKHIITSAIEHHAVLHTCAYLEKRGFRVTYLPVDEKGKINLDELKNAICDDTILISIMFANNEIGTIQPIEEIGAIAREKDVIFHTDAVQAVGNVKIYLKDSNIDLLSLSGHKIHGPKGVVSLYIRKCVKIAPFMHGGAHERNRRAGTENTAGIVGLGKALEIAAAGINAKTAALVKQRDKLIDTLLEQIPESILNGDRVDRLPGNVNICYKYIEGASLLINLDMKGIAASSGSACTSGSLDPSHVLLAIGLDHGTAHGSLRLSLGEDISDEDIDYVIKTIKETVQKLREWSPLFAAKEGGIKNV